jgi:hypothetical protein
VARLSAVFQALKRVQQGLLLRRLLTLATTAATQWQRFACLRNG